MSSIFLQDVNKEWGSKFKSCTTKLELSPFCIYKRHAPRPNTPRTRGPP